MNESVNPEPESFIVQNVTLGPHYVSDIRLNFGSLQAIDLTWVCRYRCQMRAWIKI